MSLLRAKRIRGSRPQWSSCDCFVCGRPDAVVRTTSDGTCSVVLCDGHYADYTLNYVLVAQGDATLLYGLNLSGVAVDVENFLDKQEFINLFIKQVVSRR